MPPANGKFSKIYVPTADNKKFSYILGKHITERGFKRPIMFVGPSGTAKSTISNAFIN